MKKKEASEEILTNALKADLRSTGLPLGFAQMVARKAFASRLQPLGLKSYSALLLLLAIVVTGMLVLLNWVAPGMSEGINLLLYKSKYVIGFVALTLVLIDYADKRWIAKLSGNAGAD